MFFLWSLISPEITSTDLTIPSFHTYAIDQNLLESIDFQLRASLDQGGLAEAEFKMTFRLHGSGLAAFRNLMQ